MHPVALTGRIHHKKITIGKLKGMSCLPLALAQLKGSGGAERQGGNRLAGINLCFVIGMPAHAVVSVAVAVEQATVEFGITVITDGREKR